VCLLVGVTGLFGIIVCNARLNEVLNLDKELRIAQAVEAKSRLMRFAENVYVNYLPVNDRHRISSGYLTDYVCCRVDRFSFFGFPVEPHLLESKLCLRSIWNYRKARKSIRGQQIAEMKGLPSRQGFDYSVTTEAFHWSFADVRYRKRYREWGISPHNPLTETDVDPPSLLQVELLNSGIQRFFGFLSIKSALLNGLFSSTRGLDHLAVLQIDESGVENQRDETKSRQKNRSVFVLSIGGCIVCVLVHLYAFRKVGVNDNVCRWELLDMGSLCALAYCFAVFIHASVKF